MSHSPSSHDQQVDAQFGSVAQAYLTSTVHAQGQDLQDVARLLAARPGARVLDVGCGAGHLSFAMAPHAASVVALDLSPRMLGVVADAARERGLGNLLVREGSAAALPFADGFFDVVATRFSAHHWADLDAGLREMRRVLRPGGLCVAIDIAAPAGALLDTHLQAVELLRDASHVRDHSVAQWEAGLRAAGFTVGAVRQWRLRMDFNDWVARMRTPPERVAAIRSLFDGAPEEVRQHFAVEADGSFWIDAVMVEAG